MPQFKKTPKAQSAPDILDSPALMRQSPRQSTKTKLTRVTALGTSRESRRSLCQLHRKPDTTFRAREESGLACLHTRRCLTLPWNFNRNPKIHAGVGGEHLGSCRNSTGGSRTWHRLERNPERPLTTRMETGHS